MLMISRCSKVRVAPVTVRSRETCLQLDTWSIRILHATCCGRRVISISRGLEMRTRFRWRRTMPNLRLRVYFLDILSRKKDRPYRNRALPEYPRNLIPPP